MCCFDDCCCCCGGCYDSFCDRCCPCISYDTRETIFGLCICFLLLVAVVLFAVLLAAYGFIRHVEVTVEAASLTRFALITSPATAFAYNLSLTLTVRNKNWAMSIKNTEPLEADYSFDGQRFERIKLADPGVSPRLRRRRRLRGARERRRRRVRQGERHGDFSGGGGARRQGQVPGARHQVQARRDVPAQAPARAARDYGRRLPEGQMQARRARQELLARPAGRMAGCC